MREQTTTADKLATTLHNKGSPLEDLAETLPAIATKTARRRKKCLAGYPSGTESVRGKKWVAEGRIHSLALESNIPHTPLYYTMIVTLLQSTDTY